MRKKKNTIEDYDTAYKLIHDIRNQIPHMIVQVSSVLGKTEFNKVFNKQHIDLEFYDLEEKLLKSCNQEFGKFPSSWY